MSATKSAASDSATGTSDAGRDAQPLAAFDPHIIGVAYSQTMLELQREWLVGMGQMQRDYLTFLGERMRKDIDIAKRMVECRDVEAAAELQAAFTETAREDYMDEAQKVIARSREIAEHCVERLANMKARTNGRDA